MGICLPCLSGSVEDDQPSPETKRKQLALAAEQRQKENVQRGVKDAESLKRKQQKREERERILDSQPNTSGPLRWQVS